MDKITRYKMFYLCCKTPSLLGFENYKKKDYYRCISSFQVHKVQLIAQRKFTIGQLCNSCATHVNMGVKSFLYINVAHVSGGSALNLL